MVGKSRYITVSSKQKRSSLERCRCFALSSECDVPTSTNIGRKLPTGFKFSDNDGHIKALMAAIDGQVPNRHSYTQQ